MATLVDVTFQAPKELNDVRVALVELVQLLKDKKDLTAILGKLSLFMAAVDGLAAIPQEFKEELKKSLESAGYFGGQLMGVLLA